MKLAVLSVIEIKTMKKCSLASKSQALFRDLTIYFQCSWSPGSGSNGHFPFVPSVRGSRGKRNVYRRCKYAKDSKIIIRFMSAPLVAMSRDVVSLNGGGGMPVGSRCQQLEKEQFRGDK